VYVGIYKRHYKQIVIRTFYRRESIHIRDCQIKVLDDLTSVKKVTCRLLAKRINKFTLEDLRLFFLM